MADYDKLAAKFGGTAAIDDEDRYDQIAKRNKAPAYNFMDSMSGTDRFLAGTGKAFMDTGRGIGQFFGAVSDKDVAESRKLDGPLMSTTAGKVGNFSGHVASAIPTMLIPGANTLKGAAMIGAAQGAMQPVLEDESRLANAGIGGLAGAGGVMAGRALGGAYQGGKALVEPFTNAGRDRIAGRMLNRFADDPSRIASAQGGATLTGSKPTLAELTGDDGIARLQDSLRSLDPQINSRIASRLSDNNAARVGSLQSLAGDSTKRQAAESARAAATKPFYDRAYGQTVDIDPTLDSLLQRPAMLEAALRAEKLAANSGRGSGVTRAPEPTIPMARQPDRITGQALQDRKLAMDAMLKDPTSGIVGAEADAVRSLRNQYVQGMERAIPEFGPARTRFAELSKPLNGMDVGEEISRRALSNTSNLAGDPRMQANALLGMLRDESKLVAKGTGRKELKSLFQVFDPDQLKLLRTVASESDRAAAVGAAGNGPGSATAQRMASQNVLRQMIGPTGMPSSWAEGALASTAIGKPLNVVYGGVVEPRIQQLLADAVLDPNIARQVLDAAQRGQIQLPQGAIAQLMMHSGRVAPSALAVSRER